MVDADTMQISGSIWQGLEQRTLREVFEGFGLDVTGWSDSRSMDLTPDGRTSVGIGTNADGQLQSFIAVIPEPGTGALLVGGLAALAVRRRRTSSQS